MIKKLLTGIGILVILMANVTKAQIICGAAQMEKYMPLLKGKTVGIVANKISLVEANNIIDTLAVLGVDVKKVFSPEHGFLSDADAGKKVLSSQYRGIELVSLYGNKLKPSSSDLKGIDIMLFDIQDVGVRFYTYISTLSYVMEACAENQVPLVVLDRPNPNGHYIDGPVLEEKYKSFVGMHPVPVVYGMTIGEYAQMVNGEGWLKNGIKCKLTVIALQNYDRNKRFALKEHPSPNLQSPESIWLYPSLCFFEGTQVSVGRGTEHPFEIAGMPGFTEGSYTFTPVSIPGVATHPKFEGQKCRGINLNEFASGYLAGYPHLYWYWLEGFYKSSPDKEHFFTTYFDQLAGTDKLRQAIESGSDISEIAKLFEPQIEEFKLIRKKYLIYPDFDKNATYIRYKGVLDKE